MSISQAVIQVQEQIAVAEARRSEERYTGEVKLIAVTKNQSLERIREAIEAGVVAIGENRLQEALGKLEIKREKVEWHLIGHLQTNKAKLAVDWFDLIHSLDSVRLADALQKAAQKAGKVQEVLIQVNVSGEESKYGIAPHQLSNMATYVQELPNLRLRGLMTVAPYYENPEMTRPIFRTMYELFSTLRNSGFSDVEFLSMGMSEDFCIAIEEGANLVRIGSAIFGARK